MRHDEIIATWTTRAEREGLYHLIAERERIEMVAWVRDPLPNRIPAEARGQVR